MDTLKLLPNNRLLHMVTTEAMEAAKECTPAYGSALRDLFALRQELRSRMKPDGPPKTKNSVIRQLGRGKEFLLDDGSRHRVVDKMGSNWQPIGQGAVSLSGDKGQDYYWEPQPDLGVLEIID